MCVSITGIGKDDKNKQKETESKGNKKEKDQHKETGSKGGNNGAGEKEMAKTIKRNEKITTRKGNDQENDKEGADKENEQREKSKVFLCHGGVSPRVDPNAKLGKQPGVELVLLKTR